MISPKRSFAAEELARRKQKKPWLWIIVGILIVVIVAGSFVFYQKSVLFNKDASEIRQIRSIAVLPFRDMSPGKDQDYFCEGLAEDIINALTSIDGLNVPARTSSFAFKDTDKSIKEIGNALKVDTVLEGSIFKSDNRLRITAQLNKVEDGYHLFSKNYDRELGEVFSIKDEIAAAIVEELKGTLLPDEKESIQKRPTSNSMAYDYCLKGRFYHEMRTDESFSKALECFQKAVEIDPGYALAYSGIADIYFYLGAYGYDDYRTSLERAKEAAKKASELDDSSADVQTTLGILSRDENRKEAEIHYKRAIELNPRYVPARHVYGYLLSVLGRHEDAIHQATIALELDPLSEPMTRGLGIVYYCAGDIERALYYCNKSLELSPNSVSAHLMLFVIYYSGERYDESIEHLVQYLSIRERDDLAVLVRETYRKSGYQEVIRSLVPLSDDQAIHWVSPAVLYVMIGEKKQAIAVIDRYLDSKFYYDPFISRLKSIPIFEPLRDQPGYTELLKKMNLTD